MDFSEYSLQSKHRAMVFHILYFLMNLLNDLYTEKLYVGKILVDVGKVA